MIVLKEGSNNKEEFMNLFKKNEIERDVFLPPAILLGLTLVIGMIAPQGFANVSTALLSFTIEKFGWLYLFLTFVFLVAPFVIMISPMGSIRFGGPEAKPEIDLWSWCVIALCGGIATGMLFWGVAEPLTHYYSPPAITGLEPLTPQTAIRALQLGTFHWSYIPYGLFTLFGIAIGYASYNRKLPLRVSSAFYPLLGKRIYDWPGKLIDGISILTLAGGVVTTLGFGTLQFASGLQYLFDWTPSNLIYALIIVVLTITYTVSSYTGLKRGIKYLSNINSFIFFGLVAFLFIFGPTKFLFNAMVETAGSYLTNLIPCSFNADAFNVSNGWSGGWTIFFWAWWIVYAPIIGMFLARIAIGRTIRQFVIVNVIIPGTFMFTWFVAFGGSAIYFEHFQNAGIMNVIEEFGLEVSMYALLQNLPISNITIPMGIVALGISFVTLADSMTSTIAVITTKDTRAAEPPAGIKIFWGLLIGGITMLCLLVSGTIGTKALQTMSIAYALPIFILELGALICLVMFLGKDKQEQYVRGDVSEDIKTTPLKVIENDDMEDDDESAM